MASDRRPVSCEADEKGWRAAAHTTARVPGRDSLGANQWCTLERFTNILPLTSDLLASPKGVDPKWNFPDSLAPTAPPARRAEVTPLGRGHGRRHVFPGQKRGLCVGKTKRGKGTKIMLLVDGRGTPLGVDIASASPAEVKLIEPLLNKRTVRKRPQRLIYDKAADSDPLRKRLAKRCIELICPHRCSRTIPATQDGRALRRYKRRWKIERSISWLFNYRRLVVRYERHSLLFLGLLELACAFTILKRF
jgi:transposase